MITLLLPCSLFAAEENFLLVDDLRHVTLVTIGPHVDERAAPGCSVNIALSLMGFEEGVLISKTEPVWDFKEGYADDLPFWRAPHNPELWMKHSCVWYSQLLFQRLKNAAALFDLFQYGNRDLSGGRSTLKISPQEQVSFIQRMLHYELPISRRSIDETIPLLFREELPGGWKLFGKTGTSMHGDLEIGWLVGWIEKEGKRLLYAYNIREEVVDPERRNARVKELLISNSEL